MSESTDTTEAFEQLAQLDRLVHEPARLAILTALSTCASADFLVLQKLIGLTKGNLSSHLSKLEEAGLIYVAKNFVGKIPHTTISITSDGRQKTSHHWKRLAELQQRVAAWKPAPEDLRTPRAVAAQRGE